MLQRVPPVRHQPKRIRTQHNTNLQQHFDTRDKNCSRNKRKTRRHAHRPRLYQRSARVHTKTDSPLPSHLKQKPEKPSRRCTLVLFFSHLRLVLSRLRGGQTKPADPQVTPAAHETLDRIVVLGVGEGEDLLVLLFLPLSRWVLELTVGRRRTSDATAVGVVSGAAVSVCATVRCGLVLPITRTGPRRASVGTAAQRFSRQFYLSWGDRKEDGVFGISWG